MHALQVKHLKVKDRIKKLQALAASIEADAIEAGLAERKPTTIEEFRWPKDDVIKKWDAIGYRVGRLGSGRVGSGRGLVYRGPRAARL